MGSLGTRLCRTATSPLSARLRERLARPSQLSQTLSMAKPAIDISAMTPDERLSLIGELWDSLDDLPPTLSREQSEELARRVERVRQDGPSGTTISEIRGRLLGL